MTIDATLLEAKIGELLDNFYAKRTDALADLKLIQPLKRKNPYLYRATGVSDASEIVEEILSAHVSSSDETLFGQEFFEPLAKWAAQQAYADETVETSHGEGIDLSITGDRSVKAIAVKSGVNVFNASSKKKQKENFESLGRRLHKLQRHFDPIVGYCYGRKKQSPNSKANFKELAGQAFWELMTKEKDFYLRVISMMERKPIIHRPVFQQAFTEAKNRFAKEFLNDFSNAAGAINWDKLIAFNSGVDGVRLVKPEATKPKKNSNGTDSDMLTK